MRIMCFPKLVRNEETIIHYLKDCPLVIDGQNFFYNSYEESKLPYVFGSEANEHAKYLRNMLKMFKEANIKCYIVFKGGDGDIDKKVKRLKPINFDFDSNYKYVSPVFLKEVCKQLLQESKVSYATCVAESKDDCVALAQMLGCSVLSNDIAYCLKRSPYIPYTTLKYSAKHKSIICQQYNLKNFLQKHSLSEKKVAIFFTLSDTTVFTDSRFNNLLQTWNVIDSNLYIQHKKLLKWLSEYRVNEILDEISEFLSNEDENKLFLDHVEELLSNMQNNQNGVVAEYLIDDCRLQVTRHDPLWFEKGVATQYIAIPYINLFKYKIIQGSVAIERKDINDSVMLSVDIIKYAYNLLTNFETGNISIYYFDQNATQKCTEIDTGDSNITKPRYQCTETVFENGWDDIKSLKLFEHFLTENNIDTNIINKFPVEARMLFITLLYFERKKALENINVKKEIYCFIISYVLLHVVFDNDKSIRKKNSGITEEDSAEAKRVTKHYFKVNKDEAERIFDKDELKTLVELQYCLVHMNYLNALCGMTYKSTTYSRTFNGTFVYKLHHDMKTRMKNNSEEQFIESLFSYAPTVINFVKKLLKLYKEFGSS